MRLLSIENKNNNERITIMLKRITERIIDRLESPVAYTRRIGVKVGKGFKINANNFSTEPYLIEIGNYVRIALGTFLHMVE